MPSGRAAKRARKKERRHVQRSAMRAAYMSQRRRRRTAIALVVLMVTGLGGGVAFSLFAGRQNEDRPTPTPPPNEVVSPKLTPVACGAKVPASAGSTKHLFARPTDQHLTPAKRYVLRLDTSCGRIDIELTHDKKPTTANAVVFLVRKHFYDGLVFHRNGADFVIQGGDPKGDGTGGPGFEVTEAPPSDTKYTRGIVAMANAGQPGGVGSQFFIVTAGDVQLQPDYAVLGRVVAGQDVARKIGECCPGSVNQGDPPPKVWAYIEKATVIEE